MFDSQFQDLFENVVPQFPHLEAYIMTHRPVFGMRKNPGTHEVLAEDFTVRTFWPIRNALVVHTADLTLRMYRR